MFSLIVVSICSTIAMLLAWNWQKHHDNAGVVDVVWAFGMMFAGPWYALNGDAPLFLQLSLGILTFVWFWRLGRYLQWRVFREAEDGRYHAMRRAMKDKVQLGFLLFFLLQSGFVCLLSLPFWAVAQNTKPDIYFVVTALMLAALAFYGEKKADQQLAVFRNNPENKGVTCRIGLWRYSRHPNYFFEWLHWFAYPLMGWGGEYQYWLLLAPVLMFCFLFWFTGIPFTEQQSLRSRGEDYRLYQKTTSLFIPWWPKE